MPEEKIFVVSCNDNPEKSFTDRKTASDYSWKMNEKEIADAGESYHRRRYYHINEIPLIRDE